MKTRRIISSLIILMLSAGLVFASSAQALQEEFEAAASSGEIEAAIDAHSELEDAIAKEYRSLEKDLEKAIEKNDRQLYYSTRAQMQDLSRLGKISQEDTASLLSAIVNSDSDEAQEWALWLYENSSYYHPVLTLCADASGDSYSRTYRKSVSYAPGTEVTLPSSAGENARYSGVLIGWGITPDEVTYEPGETILMPYTDQSLYAIFRSQVVFSDSESSDDTVFTDVKEGDVIQVPVPSDSQDAIFEGWYDRSSGQYLSAEDTEYTVKGMGASFEALYIKLEADEISTGPYDVTRLPAGVQIPLTFSLTNSGSEDVRDVDITVTCDSSHARLINTEAWLRQMRSGHDYTLKNVILVISQDCPSGEEIPLTVTMEDSDGNTFSSTFTLSVR